MFYYTTLSHWEGHFVFPTTSLTAIICSFWCAHVLYCLAEPTAIWRDKQQEALRSSVILHVNLMCCCWGGGGGSISLYPSSDDALRDPFFHSPLIIMSTTAVLWTVLPSSSIWWIFWQPLNWSDYASIETSTVKVLVLDILGPTRWLLRHADFVSARHLLPQALEYRSQGCLQTLAAWNTPSRWTVKYKHS